MSGQESEVHFDAGDYPEYIQAKKRGQAAQRMLILAELVGTPAILAVVFVVLFLTPVEDVDLLLIGPVFIAIVIGDVLVVFFFLMPSFRKRWEAPIRITDKGLEIAGKVIRAGEVQKVMLFGNTVSLWWKSASSKLPRMNQYPAGELGNADEFVRALQKQNPSIDVQDLRKQKKL